MHTQSWSRFTRRIAIEAAPKAIYDAFIIPAQLEKWFLRQARFIQQDGQQRKPHLPVQIGDTYLWRWYGHPDEITEQGTILEMNGKDRLRFSFGKAGIVTIQIRHEQGKYILELTQEEIPFHEQPEHNLHLDCSNGWTFYMTNLKSILEGGIDLRNKDEQLKEVINA
ncbi:SRPBCC domain-containing protein [Chitinophaga pendula]|uniref:SRPBCC family protein n=1 Tax=Chitinophaga TaxID=79328 RepID=UPI000BAFBE7E|nr:MULTISPECIES: SRPBCC domain-containing protein [Chitinophaga]ASZ10458.1 hypothetical protein CK934_05445 [Chitinophaga sp. MD30]UCJ06571.1 SRPBCC domain-containing protein [Chitinophaga pendula]